LRSAERRERKVNKGTYLKEEKDSIVCLTIEQKEARPERGSITGEKGRVKLEKLLPSQGRSGGSYKLSAPRA